MARRLHVGEQVPTRSKIHLHLGLGVLMLPELWKRHSASLPRVKLFITAVRQTDQERVDQKGEGVARHPGPWGGGAAAAADLTAPLTLPSAVPSYEPHVF